MSDYEILCVHTRATSTPVPDNQITSVCVCIKAWEIIYSLQWSVGKRVAREISDLMRAEGLDEIRGKAGSQSSG